MGAEEIANIKLSIAVNFIGQLWSIFNQDCPILINIDQ